MVSSAAKEKGGVTVTFINGIGFGICLEEEGGIPLLSEKSCLNDPINLAHFANSGMGIAVSSTSVDLVIDLAAICSIIGRF